MDLTEHTKAVRDRGWPMGPDSTTAAQVKATAGVRDARITMPRDGGCGGSLRGRPRRTLLRAGALGGSVLGQEPADVQFFRTRAEGLQELGALGVVFGEVVGEEGLRGDGLGPGAERGAQVE